VHVLECEQRYQRRRREWSRPEAHDGEGEAIRARRWYRLLSVCQITQRDYMLRKVLAGCYEEALALATLHGLGTDIIYKHMWRSGCR
jgi:hypothetical protein